MRYVWVSFKVFAYLMFLFLPSIAVLLVVAFFVPGTVYFVGLGTTALVVNGLYFIRREKRATIGRKLQAIADAR